ncbi:hypothetical protein BSU04_31760 [Caballeronia sordidicola]|uniref:Uncharacterized protein n=1 Tax=Caballeronia sordidicola TaxID=196367 RepID=A0A226WTJ1_CABSO|nr:hypothetical protein BSU04_31760 [Caballeronia sordidicola]
MLNAGHTIQIGLNHSIKVPLDAFQLFALTDDVCATLNPQRLRYKCTGVFRLNGI